MSGFPSVPRYRVCREIGRGAMGIVYEAEHRELGRRVALKTIHPLARGKPLAEARLAREARVAALLQHPHIVQVLDGGATDEGPFLAMELVDGPSLDGYLRDRGACSVQEAMAIALPLAAALVHAHDRGVVHRDIKPANILLAKDHVGDSCPKIGDFGIGKRLDGEGEASLTKDGFIGTLPYVAPEQLRDPKSSGPRADQYSFAVLIYELCAGGPPFTERGEFALMEAICRGAVRPLSEVAPGVPPSLAAAIARAMSTNPELRYPSVRAFGKDLLRFASGRCWSAWSREFSTKVEDGPQSGTTSADDDAGRIDDWAFVVRQGGGRLRWGGAALGVACFGLGALVTGLAFRSRAHAPEAPVSPVLLAQTAPSASAPARDAEPVTIQDPPPTITEEASLPHEASPRATPAPDLSRPSVRRAPSPSRNHVEIGQNRAPIIE